MNILVNRQMNQDQVVILFGLGMIGRTIQGALAGYGFETFSRIPIDWRIPGRLEQKVNQAQHICETMDPSPGKVSLVWSAGRSNFFSSTQELNDENDSFEATLRLVSALNDSLPDTRLEYHFFSSAGGLFEGQRIVGNESRPDPKRAYGKMKLAQEGQLQTVLNNDEMSIYRPSSVYGPMVQQRKHGLINHLIADAADRQTSVLDANVLALRDYVYAGDIGSYVARRINFGSAGSRQNPFHFLVSARCASIYEVVSRIERIMKVRVRARFDENFGNSASITFSDSVLPKGWNPSTLDVGIRQFILRDRPQTRAISADAVSVH